MSDRSDHHHHHHHHHRHSDSSSDDDQPPPPFPPPSFHPPPHRPDFPPYDDRPPPPPHFSPYDQPPPPPPSYDNQPPPHFPPEKFSGGYQNPYPGAGSHYAPAPDPSYGHPHQDQDPDAGEERHRYRPHVPAFIESHIHGHGHQTDPSSGSSSGPLDLSSKPSVKVYCQADPNHLLAIRDGKVILARSDPNDLTQHWVKDERYSTKVKDQDRYPSFALVNKATGQALKHSTGATHPVQLIAYNPEVLDESVLWTMGKDLGSDYRQIRMVNNTRLVFDAFNGDKKHGGVHDGTTVVLWEPGKGDNQRWHITPY